MECNIEHVLVADSSSARLLCMRQATGKVKHLSAKSDGCKIVMSQSGTAFNVADIGTKVLSAKRFKTLSRDIGILDDDGASAIHVEERGSAGVRNVNQQMMRAVRTIARLAILMGLEPTLTAAATTTAGDGNFMGECAIDASTGTCGAAETAIETHGSGLPVMLYIILVLWCIVTTTLLARATRVGYKRIRAIETDAGHLALQVANADATIGEHMAAIPRLDSRIDWIGECNGETQQNMDMLSDAMAQWMESTIWLG